MNEGTGKNLQKVANNPVSDEEEQYSIVLKVIYGMDKKENLFIYIKLKNFKLEGQDNMFLPKSYIVMYQNPKGKYTEDIIGRQDKIIELMKDFHVTSAEREFDGKQSFFIKGKLFREIDNIDKFYISLISELVKSVGPENVPQSTIDILLKDDLIDSPAPMNFFKRILYKKDEGK